LAQTTFVLLSFEGPDLYAHAGGIGSRVDELSRTLAGRGFETHLFFIGDPELPSFEVTQGGNLHLHRWCQWISAYHPGGVYEGEEGKLRDWQDSLPPWLETELLAPRIARGENIVVLAEEWQTAETVVRLHDIVERRGWLDRVHLLWNANNTFSFDRIDWRALDDAATVTTVSRYMKHEMWERGVDPRVIPNGIEDAWLVAPPVSAVSSIRRLLTGRTTMLKVGRFDPNKRWLCAVEAVALLKQAGKQPLLIARGGSEAHGWDVYNRAEELDLRMERCTWSREEGLAADLARCVDADIVFLDGHLDFDDRKALYRAADAVLANSAIEPFGLVGLEAMASGGLVLVGCTGEDYALSGHDSIALQTASPGEIVHHMEALTSTRTFATRMRKAARTAAGRFTWSSVLDRALLPLLRELGVNLPAPERAVATPPRRRNTVIQTPIAEETATSAETARDLLLAATPANVGVAARLGPALT
jgi:glycosyltransferase involved in cell wall biosynthesis